MRKTFSSQLSDSLTYRRHASHETSTELSKDHRTTSKTSEDCRWNTARWSCVHCSHYVIECIYSCGKLFLNHFPDDGKPYHCYWDLYIHKGRGAYWKRGNCILWRSCSWRADLATQNYLTFNWQGNQGSQHMRQWVCFVDVLWLSCGPKNPAILAA